MHAQRKPASLSRFVGFLHIDTYRSAPDAAKASFFILGAAGRVR